MQKLIALFAALCLMCACLPAGAEEDITGTWSGTIGGIALSLTLEADHGYTMSVGGLPNAPGTWSYEGGTLHVGSLFTLTRSGDSLENRRADITLKRGDAEPIYTPAEPDPEAAEAAYAGDWIADYMEVEGLMMDARYLAAAMKADGNIRLSFEGTAFRYTYLSPENVLLSPALAYRDGGMHYEDELNTISLDLLQDGKLRYSHLLNGEETIVYFSPAEYPE